MEDDSTNFSYKIKLNSFQKLFIDIRTDMDKFLNNEYHSDISKWYYYLDYSNYEFLIDFFNECYDENHGVSSLTDNEYQLLLNYMHSIFDEDKKRRVRVNIFRLGNDMSKAKDFDKYTDK